MQPEHPPGRPRPNRILLKLVVFVVLVLAAVIAGLIIAARPSHATGQPGTGHASAGVVPGGTCDTPGVEARHGAQRYRCWQKPGEDCPHWHWAYNPDVPKSTRTVWPAGPCTTCSPSTPAPPSSPVAAPHPADTSPPAAIPPPTSPAADTLPVTGQSGSVLLLVPLGVAAVVAGSVLRFSRRARRSVG